VHVVLTGGSGFIGERLIQRLLRDGHSVHLLGRRRPPASSQVGFSEWNASDSRAPQEPIASADAIVHLAGEPVAQRWNADVKKRIRDSRVNGTRVLVEAIARSEDRPHTFISASAVGYYGDRGDTILDESSARGSGFLPDVCVAWENEASAAGKLGVRVVMLRTGIVLGQGGGALKKMLPPFRMGVGGPIGSGAQWVPWIHIDDLVDSILFSRERTDLVGPVNTVAPNPVRNRDFAKALGNALGRPAVIPTPGFALKLILGEGADVVAQSQRVVPKALERAGFEFRYPEIHGALRNAI
jgi:uncharacterized protein (TIGR01777 family)